MTYRELRQVLTCVENQEMNIKELRAILFDIENQDEKIDELELGKLTTQRN